MLAVFIEFSGGNKCLVWLSILVVSTNLNFIVPCLFFHPYCSTTLNFIGACFFSILDVSTTLNFIGTPLFFHHHFSTTLNFISACLFFHPYCFFCFIVKTDNQSCTREVLYLLSFCCKPSHLCQPHLCKRVLYEFPFSNQFLQQFFSNNFSPTNFSPTNLLPLIWQRLGLGRPLHRTHPALLQWFLPPFYVKEWIRFY